MPSPYGMKRSADSYYQYAGSPQHYILNWTGMPEPGTRAGETRGLGDYPVSMSMASGRRSVLHSGTEQTHIYDGLGQFGLSRNEKRFLVIAGAGIAGYLLWKKMKK